MNKKVGIIVYMLVLVAILTATAVTISGENNYENVTKNAVEEIKTTCSNGGNPFDVSIQKKDTQGICEWADVGEVITYNITYELPQGVDFYNVYVRDDIPDELEYKNSSHNDNNQDHWAEWVICEDGVWAEQFDLEDTIWLNVSVANDAELGIEVRNNVTLYYEYESTTYEVKDYELSNVGQPIYNPLEITKDDNKPNDSVGLGGQINYTIEIKNQNNLTVRNVYITDEIPSEVEFNSSSMENFVEYIETDDGSWVVWYFEEIFPKQEESVWLVVDVKPTFPPGTQIVNTAEVSYVQECSDLTIENEVTETTWIEETIAPNTTKEIENPSHDSGQWITTHTPIILTAVDDHPFASGVQTLNYIIKWNSPALGWILIEEIQITDNSAEDLDDEIGVIKTVLYFDEECEHEIIFWAEDKVGNQEEPISQIHYVDDSGPNVDWAIQGAYDKHFYKHADLWYIGVPASSSFYLRSQNDLGCTGGVGVDHITFKVYWGQTKGHMVLQYTLTVLDNVWPDLDDSEGSIVVEVPLVDSCWHQIEYWAEDHLENRNPRDDSFHSIEIIVDDDAPLMDSYYEGPHYIDEHGDEWITNSTEKYINAYDQGCIAGGSGVHYVDWSIEKFFEGVWTISKEGRVYDNSLKDLDGTPATPMNGDVGGLVAIDSKREPYTFKDTNGNWIYDYNDDHKDDIIDIDPDGDGFIEQFKAEPVDGQVGGLWAMDYKNEPYLFQDLNSDWKLSIDDLIIHYDADFDSELVDEDPIDGIDEDPADGYNNDHDKIDKHLAEPTLDDLGGYFVGHHGAQYDPYTFHDLNSNWEYETYTEVEDKDPEPIASLKPDYDGAGTVSLKLTVYENCQHLIKHSAVDWFGNECSEEKQYVKVDNEAPLTDMNVGEPAHGSCVTTNTPITLVSADSQEPCAVGLDYIYYEINGQEYYERNWEEVTFYLEEEQHYTVKWYAVDLLGNVELEKEASFNVNNDPIEIIIYPGQLNVEGLGEPDFWITSETPIYIEVGDNDCTGCLNVRYRINQGDWYYLTASEAAHHKIPIDFISEEKRYELEVQADDCLHEGKTEKMIFYVDDTAPTMYIIKPHNGWYSYGSSIGTLVFAKDEASIESEVGAVGLSQGKSGRGFLIDVFPNFQVEELDNSNFAYDYPEFETSLKIKEDCSLEDGPVIMVVQIEDDLGNSMNNIVDMLYDYYQTSNGDEDVFNSLISSLLSNKMVVNLGIDNEAPSVSICEPMDYIGSEPFEVLAFATDDVSITNGADCYVTLDNSEIDEVNIGSVIFEDGMANGFLTVPDAVSSGTYKLTVYVFDDAGNKGMDYTTVTYSKGSDGNVPSVTIVGPASEETHKDNIHVEINVDDSDSPIIDKMYVTVWTERQNDPPFDFEATYNPSTENFEVDINVSKFKDNSKLKITAYAQDEDDNTGVSMPIVAYVDSEVVFDQWMYSGWNSINLGMIGSGGPIEEVFSSIEGIYDIIFEVGTGKNYIPEEGGNTLTIVEPGKTYWINMGSPERFYINGGS